MKKITFLLISTMLFLMFPCFAFGAGATVEAPVLNSISFKNADINEKFSSSKFDYTITLQDAEQTPTLDTYELSGDANIFITYSTDDANHQNGIVATIEYENGSLIYTFLYSNVKYEINSNNYLASLNCNLCEVYPEITKDETEYKLYIPSDLAELKLSATTQDVNASCDTPAQISIGTDQEPTITITVIASNGDKRVYTFQVKRLNKTSAQIEKEMASPDFTSIVDGELFYQKPIFSTTIISVIGGIILVLIFISVAKKLAVKVNDDDEVTFFTEE